MSYNRTFWKDHVTEFQDRYKETVNDDGTISHEVIEGEIIQQGTAQNARNFNGVEEGTFAANEAAAEAVRMLLIHARKLKQLSGISGVVSLTNSQEYPFNNSVKTVALLQRMDTTEYTVEVEVISSAGEIGRVAITDKQKNGFKIAYTGGAPAATLKYAVKGGFF